MVFTPSEPRDVTGDAFLATSAAAGATRSRRANAIRSRRCPPSVQSSERKIDDRTAGAAKRNDRRVLSVDEIMSTATCGVVSERRWLARTIPGHQTSSGVTGYAHQSRNPSCSDPFATTSVARSIGITKRFRTSAVCQLAYALEFHVQTNFFFFLVKRVNLSSKAIYTPLLDGEGRGKNVKTPTN